MNGDDDTRSPRGLDGLAARLEGLKRKMEAGLPARAGELGRSLEALRAGDQTQVDVLRREAHKLRGVAGSYGYHRLTELAAAAEEAARHTPDALIASVETLIRELETHGSASPAPEPVASVPEVRKAPAMVGALSGWRVCAADDDEATRKLLGLTLGQFGKADAQVVGGAAELIELLGRERHDVAICDAMMPQMNGLEFLRAVVEQDLAESASVFAILSAASLEELGWNLPPSLRVAWLRKPFRPADLIQQIVDLGARPSSSS